MGFTKKIQCTSYLHKWQNKNLHLRWAKILHVCYAVYLCCWSYVPVHCEVALPHFLQEHSMISHQLHHSALQVYLKTITYASFPPTRWAGSCFVQFENFPPVLNKSTCKSESKLYRLWAESSGYAEGLDAMAHPTFADFFFFPRGP